MSSHYRDQVQYHYDPDEPEDRRGHHRWSGWPGAWCLDCGADDALEIVGSCAACKYGDLAPGDNPCDVHAALPGALPCPTPGAARFDPYRTESR